VAGRHWPSLVGSCPCRSRHTPIPNSAGQGHFRVLRLGGDSNPNTRPRVPYGAKCGLCANGAGASIEPAVCSALVRSVDPEGRDDQERSARSSTTLVLLRRSVVIGSGRRRGLASTVAERIADTVIYGGVVVHPQTRLRRPSNALNAEESAYPSRLRVYPERLSDVHRKRTCAARLSLELRYLQAVESTSPTVDMTNACVLCGLLQDRLSQSRLCSFGPRR
jgi:hypothetical protein